ncbi:DUF3549 family protein [Motiliproteus sp. SC1-56]|uniref:DUF3549 family protein n=1 Tax=Motiliproteus sp. SC1-56 TaxID=2799565 RepID=UPI001A8DED1B|nr:DUF3549 family protein [Motiliproteus sp. SC1-56]
MQPIQTLTEFLRSTDAQFRLFDMGRRVSKLSPETFLRFERAELPYPLPFLHQAWIAVLLWNPKQVDQHLVWFLKLPLDEQGLLVQAARDDFLHRLARSVGDQLLERSAEEDPLKDNPFSFTPDQEKMAAFHARATLTLKQPVSAYYQPARAYFGGDAGYEGWDQLGLQGIADMAARLEEQDNEARLTNALHHLPTPPLEALAASLEHAEPGHRLSEALGQRLETELLQGQASPNLIGALLRGLSQGRPATLRQQAIERVLQTPYAHEPEVIAAIASRCWRDLTEASLRTAFFEALALNKAGQACFNRVVADLVFLPGMRGPVMESFRNPERSEALGTALGGFFGRPSQAQ